MANYLEVAYDSSPSPSEAESGGFSVHRETRNKWPLLIGESVTIGHGVVAHGCVIKDYCLIGIGARILDGAQVGPRAMVAAGAVVREGFVVPEYSLVAGVPAAVKRRLTDHEIENLAASAQRYVEYKNVYLAAGIQHASVLKT